MESMGIHEQSDPSLDQKNNNVQVHKMNIIFQSQFLEVAYGYSLKLPSIFKTCVFFFNVVPLM